MAYIVIFRYFLKISINIASIENTIFSSPTNYVINVRSHYIWMVCIVFFADSTVMIYESSDLLIGLRPQSHICRHKQEIWPFATLALHDKILFYTIYAHFMITAFTKFKVY